jgi:hypothetical protein
MAIAIVSAMCQRGCAGFLTREGRAGNRKRDAWKNQRVHKVRKYTNKYLVAVLYV